MRVSRAIAPAVYLAEQRLNAVLALGAREGSAAEIAAANDCATSTLYLHKLRVLQSLEPKRRGPRPGHRDLVHRAEAAEQRALVLQRQLDEERVDHARVRSQSIRVRRELLLTCTLHGMPLRGVAELFSCLGFSLADSKSSLAEELERLGRHAHWMLRTAARSLAPSMTVLAGDEIFFRRDAIKVLMEPRSAAVLDVQRWPQRGSDEWQLMLSDFPALELFVSDDGSDLRSAAQKHGAGLGADFFHERRWFARVLGKLSAAEAELTKQLIELKKHGASGGPHDRERCMLIARTEIERRRAEAAFFAVMTAEEQVVALFMPLDPDGRLWDDDAIWRCLTAAIRAMDKLEGAAGERLREKIRKHVARRGTQCAGHTLLWRTVPIGMRSDATWSRERVLSALIERVRLRGQCRDDTRTRYEQYLSEQAVRALDEALSRQVEDVEQAYRAVRLLLKRPARSSSLVESFNARLRVLQQSRRNVSDALLGLLAFRWNTSRREEGPRRLQSPWQTLGLIEKEDTRTWVELLLDSLPDD